MKVKELITRLLDEPMYAEVMVQTDWKKKKSEVVNGTTVVTKSGTVFDIDVIEHWSCERVFINFTDWRADDEYR